MSDNSQSARERADRAFGKTQTQFLARNRIVAENDAIANEREAKTARLKEMRLQKEAQELVSAVATRPSRRSAKI